MNACSANCGWCGRCTDALEGGPEQKEYVFCDECHQDAFYPVSLPFGVFCSHACADIAEAKFTEGMKRRGFMEVQPQLVENES
jgi:hypothetical protein